MPGCGQLHVLIKMNFFLIFLSLHRTYFIKISNTYRTSGFLKNIILIHIHLTNRYLLVRQEKKRAEISEVKINTLQNPRQEVQNTWITEVKKIRECNLNSVWFLTLTAFGATSLAMSWSAGVGKEYIFHNWMMPLLDYKYRQKAISRNNCKK